MAVYRKPALSTGAFDLLRARVENDVPCPAVIAITSSTQEDGAEVAAFGLANSLALAGYRTILVDTVPIVGFVVAKPVSTDFESLARRAIGESEVTGRVSRLSLADPTSQKTTSQRSVQNALETLRGTFDYVVVCTEAGTTTSLGASVIAVANAVLVTVKKGRREKPVDAILAGELQRPGVRFMGILAVDSNLAKSDPKLFAVETGNDVRHVASAIHPKKVSVAGE